MVAGNASRIFSIEIREKPRARAKSIRGGEGSPLMSVMDLVVHLAKRFKGRDRRRTKERAILFARAHSRATIPRYCGACIVAGGIGSLLSIVARSARKDRREPASKNNKSAGRNKGCRMGETIRAERAEETRRSLQTPSPSSLESFCYPRALLTPRESHSNGKLERKKERMKREKEIKHAATRRTSSLRLH